MVIPGWITPEGEENPFQECQTEGRRRTGKTEDRAYHFATWFASCWIENIYQLIVSHPQLKHITMSTSTVIGFDRKITLNPILASPYISNIVHLG